MNFKNIRSLSQLFAYFFVAFRLKNIVMLVLMLVSGVMDGIGVVAMLPLLELVIQDGVVGGSGLAVGMNELFASIGITPNITFVLGLIVVAMSVKGFLLFLAMRQVGSTSAEVGRLIRLRLVRAVLTTRWDYHTEAAPGNLAAAISAEPARATLSFIALCQIIVSLIQIVVYFLIAAIASWWITLVALFTGGLSFLFLRVFIRASHRAGREQTEYLQQIMTRLLDGLNGIKPLKAMACEERLIPLLKSDIDSRARAERNTIVSREALTQFQEPIKAAALAVGIFVMIIMMEVPFEMVLVLSFLFLRILQRIDVLPRQYQKALDSEPAFKFIMSLLKTAESQREQHNGVQAPVLEHGIRLERVSFAYDSRRVLNEVSMEVPYGKFAAVVGPSGGGKSTLADLIIGLHEPSAGIVMIDDVPLSELDIRKWRGLIGYVPQEHFLFNETLRTNLTLGDESISDADVIDALKDAEILDFVESNPEGLDMNVGEKGMRLSGGQRQRIALARALVRRPRLLILDEATTGLDPQTEAEVLATLRGLAGKVTILAISHQPALVGAADIVYRLEEGSITLYRGEDGIHGGVDVKI